MKKRVYKIVHNLRQKDEDTKRTIIHAFMFFFAFVLFVFWTWSLGKNVTDENTRAKIKNDFQPFAELKNDLVGNAGSAVFELKGE